MFDLDVFSDYSDVNFMFLDVKLVCTLSGSTVSVFSLCFSIVF